MLIGGDFKYRRGAKTLIVGTAIALAMSATIAPPAFAANGIGNFADWQVSGMTGTLPPVSDGKLGGSIDATQNLSAPSGASAWLGAWTPFGQEFGSSQNKRYLSVPVGATTSSLRITFDTPTPSSKWAFALGDVDAERVQISARDNNGNSVNVSSWHSGSFNYCNGSPRPSSCGGVQTDTPTWVGSELVGNVNDTTGASGWFQPTAMVKSITLSATSMSGFPTYQVWLAADKVITPVPPPPPPTPVEPPVTLTPSQTVCTARTKTISLSGTTRRKSQRVNIFAAAKVGAKSKLIRRVKSKNRKFRVKRVSTSNCQIPVFCAQSAGKVSAPVKLRVKVRKRAELRGEIAKRKPFRCPARGSR